MLGRWDEGVKCADSAIAYCNDPTLDEVRLWTVTSNQQNDVL